LFEVLQVGVEGPHRPENWLVRQLINCEPKLACELGFIREKGNATTRAVQWNLEIGSLVLR
jgi:hypothetical protein